MHALKMLLLHPYLLLSIAAMMPMVEASDALVQFFHASNAFVCQFTGVVYNLQKDLFTFYENLHTLFVHIQLVLEV